jgi:hypothetical protein
MRIKALYGACSDSNAHPRHYPNTSFLLRTAALYAILRIQKGKAKEAATLKTTNI